MALIVVLLGGVKGEEEDGFICLIFVQESNHLIDLNKKLVV